MDFGRCPRVFCAGQPCLPVGSADIPRTTTVKIYCPKCEDVYYPRSKYQGSILSDCFNYDLIFTCKASCILFLRLSEDRREFIGCLDQSIRHRWCVLWDNFPTSFLDELPVHEASEANSRLHSEDIRLQNIQKCEVTFSFAVPRKLFRPHGV